VLFALPYVGFWLFWIATAFFGIGAIVLTIYRYMRPHLETAVAI